MVPSEHAHAAHTPDSKKHCRICDELISLHAKKCIHCGSYQNWRRFLAVSSAIAFGLSLFATSVAVWPVVREAWRRPDSDIRVVSVPRIQSGHVFLLVTNYGKKPGTLDIVTLNLPIEGPNRIWLHLMRGNGPNSGVALADSVREFDYAAEFPATHMVPGVWDPTTLTPQALAAEKAELSGTCLIDLDVTSYKGVSTTLHTKMDCVLLRELIQQYWDDAQRGIHH